MANPTCGITRLGLRDGEMPLPIRVEPEYADGVDPGLYSAGPEAYKKYAALRLKYLQDKGILAKDLTELPGNYAH